MDLICWFICLAYKGMEELKRDYECQIFFILEFSNSELDPKNPFMQPHDSINLLIPLINANAWVAWQHSVFWAETLAVR
jgi:hypothetical protein